MEKTKKGLKVVALFEGVKGVISLVVGFGLHVLVGKDIQQILESLLLQLHFNPASRFPSIILHEVSFVSNSNLTLVALGAFVYSLVRFIEAYGLWQRLVWTQWFALVSGAVYLPFEVYEVITNKSILSIIVLSINVVIVWYLYSLLKKRAIQN